MFRFGGLDEGTTPALVFSANWRCAVPESSAARHPNSALPGTFRSGTSAWAIGKRMMGFHQLFHPFLENMGVDLRR